MFIATVDSGLSGVAQVEKLYQYSTTCRNGASGTRPLVFLAWPETSVVLLAAAASFPAEADVGIAAMNMPYSWPWKELSPEYLIRQNKIPLLLFTAADDDSCASHDAQRLREQVQKSGLLDNRLYLIQSEMGPSCRHVPNLLPYLSWFAGTLRNRETTLY